MTANPKISKLQWVSASSVLKHEAHDFTPWLAKNLDLLADELGLDNLELVQTEWKVGTFALDILAKGLDQDGEVAVVIENQYGITDHKHLGQILTYSAHEAAAGRRVLAVWIAEKVKSEHLATVEFLNRIAAAGSTYGIVLMTVRFTGIDGAHLVHFEQHTQPNAFLHEGKDYSTTAKGAHILAVAPLLQAPLAELGMIQRGEPATDLGVLRYSLPDGAPLPKSDSFRVVATANHTTVGFYLESGDAAGRNWAVAEAMRRTYEELAPSYGLDVVWHGSALSTKRDRIITTLGIGYESSKKEEVVGSVATVARAWQRMFREHPCAELMELAAEIEDPE